MAMTIKPITIKPVKLGAAPAPAAAPAAPAPAAAAPAPAPAAPAPAAPAAAPGGIRPIVIAPRPAPAAAPKPAAPAPVAAAPAPAAAPVAAAAPAAAPAPTIRLKPVTPAPSGSVAAPAPAAAAPKPAAPKPIVLAPPAKPGATDPASAAEAAKGKTSRISLDEALATTPSAGTRIAMGRLTTNLSGAAAAAAPQPAEADEAPTLRKKPLVLKKPDAPATDEDDKPTLRIKPVTQAAETASRPKITLRGATPAAAAKPVTSTNDAIEAPPPAFGGNALDNLVKPEKVSVAFPVVAALAAIVTIGILLLFASQYSGPDRSLTQFSSWRNGPSVALPGVNHVNIR